MVREKQNSWCRRRLLNPIQTDNGINKGHPLVPEQDVHARGMEADHVVAFWKKQNVLMFALWMVLFPPFSIPVSGQTSNIPALTVRASTILDLSVEDKRGEKIGEIDDVIIDETGHIYRLVVAIEPILGIETRLVAVLFDEIKIEREWKYRDRITEGGLKERIPWALKWKIVYTGDVKKLEDKEEYHYDYENPRGGTTGWGIYSYPMERKE
jgi:sporulation protein YlmC with PRC-barrel domain